VREILETMLECVRGCPDGAPAGPMYAGVMQYMTLAQFEACMAALVELGCIRKSGHVYHFIKNLP
jgi:hypothetical protein